MDEYLSLDCPSGLKATTTALADAEVDEVAVSTVDESSDSCRDQESSAKPRVESARRRRVFLTHGKNRKLLPTIQKLLSFGELEAVVSVERPSVSQPVPDKIMSDMRQCGAAIIHVDQERVLHDAAGESEVVLNSNVLIEIGAAMALFGRRFILLVREGVVLPSNLQGLFEVRYSGDDLDGSATIKLLESINDIKNHSLPTLVANGVPT